MPNAAVHAYVLSLCILVLLWTIANIALMLCCAPHGSLRPPCPTASWPEVESIMGTGDLLLVRSTGLLGRVIHHLAQTWYTHVAMVIRNPPPGLLQLFPLSLQSSSSSLLQVLD